MAGITATSSHSLWANASPRAQELADWLRDTAARRLDLALSDERRALPPHVFLDFGRAGLFGVQGELEWGGLAFGPTDSLFLAEQFGALDLTLSIGILLQSFLATPPIRNYGSEAVKTQYLPLLVSGRILASYCLTETGAGSDPRRIQTTARQQSDGWLLNGEKIWSGNAASAQLLVVFAKTFDETGRELGISAFAVDRDTPGVSQGPEARTMGLRGMVQNSMQLQNAHVPAANLLGKSGEGLKIGGETMAFARLVIGAICLGTMKRCLKIAANYARERRIGSGPIAQNPTVLAQLEEFWGEALATETLIAFATRELEAGRILSDEFYAAIKVLTPEMLGRVADGCLQLLGGRGYLENNVLARIVRDARILRIFEGPTETLAAYLGARLWNNFAPFVELLQAFDGAHEVEKLKQLLDQSRNVVQSATPENQRALILRSQFLLGQIAADALALAALRTHENANCAMKQRAISHWEAGARAFDEQIELTTPEDLLDAIADFCAPIAEMTPFFAGESWGMDALLI